MTTNETEPTNVPLEEPESAIDVTLGDALRLTGRLMASGTAGEVVPSNDAAKPSGTDMAAGGTLLTGQRHPMKPLMKSATSPPAKGPSKARAAQYAQEHKMAREMRRKDALKNGKGVAAQGSHWMTYPEAWKYVGGLDKHEGYRKIKIFDEIRVAEDGGFSEIGTKSELWSNTRPLFGIIAIIFAVVNPLMLIRLNLSVLLKETTMGQDSQGVGDSYLLTTAILHFVSRGSVDITSYSVQVVLAVELIMLGVLFVQVFYYIGCTIFSRQFRRWHACSKLFFDLLTTAGSFSGMKILFYIAPQVLSNQFCYVLFYQTEQKVLTLVWLVVSRSILLIVGMDTFLVKYRMVQNDIFVKEFDFNHFLVALLFLNQVLKAVDLAWVIRERLFRYVFGGEDGVMTKREVIRMNTWNARVVQKIFQSYPLWQAVSILATWSDDDFQLLTLNDAKGVGTSEVAALDDQVLV
jgi:hypothetical protein